MKTDPLFWLMIFFLLLAVVATTLIMHGERKKEAEHVSRLEDEECDGA